MRYQGTLITSAVLSVWLWDQLPNIIWELVRNVNSGTSSHTYRIRNAGGKPRILCLTNPSDDSEILLFENLCVISSFWVVTGEAEGGQTQGNGCSGGEIQKGGGGGGRRARAVFR